MSRSSSAILDEGRKRMIKISKLMSTLELIANNPKQFGIRPDLIDDYSVRIMDNGYDDREMVSIAVESGECKNIIIEISNKR